MQTIISSTDIHAALRYRRRRAMRDEQLRQWEPRRAVGMLGASAAAVPGPSAPDDYVPLDEGSCALWLDFTEPTVSFTHSGGLVTSAVNRASAVAFTIDVAPGWSASGLGTTAAALFTGTQYLTTTEAAVLNAINSQPNTIFATNSFANKDADGTLLCTHRVSTSGSGYSRVGQSSAGAGSYLYGRRTTSSTNAVSPAGFVVTVPIITEWWCTTTTVSLNISGAASVTNLAMVRYPLGSQGRAIVGASDLSSGTLADFLSGKVQHLLIYSVELDSAARARVRAYLGAEGSIAYV